MQEVYLGEFDCPRHARKIFTNDHAQKMRDLEFPNLSHLVLCTFDDHKLPAFDAPQLHTLSITGGPLFRLQFLPMMPSVTYLDLSSGYIGNEDFGPLYFGPPAEKLTLNHFCRFPNLKSVKTSAVDYHKVSTMLADCGAAVTTQPLDD